MTETERTVARGAAAPPERDAQRRDGHTAATRRRARRAHARRRPPLAATRARPRTSRARRCRWATARRRRPLGRRAARVLAVVARRRRGRVRGRPARRRRRRRRSAQAARRAGRRRARSRVSSQDFAAAYGEEDTAALGRLLTRDAERVVPGARQEGRAAGDRRVQAPVRATPRRAASSPRPRRDRRRDRPGERPLRRRPTPTSPTSPARSRSACCATAARRGSR